MKFFKLLMLFTVITSNFSYGQCEKRINDYIQMIKSMSCSDANNPNSQAMINLDRVGKELANSCSMLFVQRGEEIKKATIDKVNSCGSNINSNSQSNNQSNNNNSTYNSNSSSNSQNSSSSVGTSSMNRGGNIVTGNSNSQNSNNQEEEIARQQQEKIRLQQEKTNQEVKKANEDIAKAKEKIYEESRQEQITNINEQNKIVNNTIETVNNTITEGTKESNNSKINNQQVLKTTQEKYKIFNLSEKEIKTLLSNSSKNDYVTIFVYNQHKVKNNTSWNVYVNGYKIAALVKGEKTEYRVYQCDNELTVQLISVGGFLQIEKPIITQTIRVKKGKDYHFTIKQKGLNYTFEQIESEPENNKLVNKFKEIKSDIDY